MENEIHREKACLNPCEKNNHEDSLLDKQNEAEQDQAAQRTLEAILEQVPVGITIADGPEGTIRRISRFGKELLGLEEKDVEERRSSFEIFYPDGTPARREDLPLARITRKGEKIVNEEWVVKNSAGDKMAFLCNGGPVRDSQGRITSGVLTWTDITDLKTAKKLASDQAEELKTVFSALMDAVFEIDTNGIPIRANPAASELCGLNPAQQDLRFDDLETHLKKISIRHLDDTLLRQDDLPGKRALKGETMRNQPLRVRDTRGNELVILASASPLFKGGQITGAVIALHDITREKRREEDLRESEARLRFVVENSPDNIFIQDRELRYVWVSRPVWPLKREEYIGKTDWDLATPEDAGVLTTIKEQVIRDNRPTKVEIPLTLKDQARIFEATYEPWRDKTGQVIGLAGYARDITERYETEKELVRSRHELEKRVQERTAEIQRQAETLREKQAELEKNSEILQTIVDNIPVMLTYYNREGQMLLLNRAFERLTGWTLEEARNIDLMADCYPDPEYRKEVWDFMMEAGPGWKDCQLVAKSGKELPSSWANVRLSDGAQIGIGIDITERKKAEERLRHLSSQLLSAQENERKLVARELHDSIGSILSAVKVSLEGKNAEATKAGVSFDPMISLVGQAIEETRRIMSNLRPSMLDDLGILPTIAWYIREREKLFPSLRFETDIRIREDEIPEDSKVVIFRVMQEAINNITKHSRADRVRLALVSRRDRIRLEITDNGRGFDPGKISHRGLGLSSMRERVEFSGGTFEIRSSIGSGTNIIAQWPIRD